MFHSRYRLVVMIQPPARFNVIDQDLSHLCPLPLSREELSLWVDQSLSNLFHLSFDLSHLTGQSSLSMERLYLFLLISAPLFLCQGNTFTIPLLFGNLSFGKNPDGTTNVNVGSNVNILGNGAKRNTTFTVGNGTFLVKDDANAIVNNTDFGGGGTFGVQKEGQASSLVLDNKINANNKTIEGGLGKESNFLSSLFGAFGRN